jgi:hypothetical protein
MSVCYSQTFGFSRASVKRYGTIGTAYE